MAKKKKRPAGPKGHQLAAIDGIVSRCTKNREFKAGDVRAWLKAIKKSHITNHLVTLTKQGKIEHKGHGTYSKLTMTPDG